MKRLYNISKINISENPVYFFYKADEYFSNDCTYMNSRDFPTYMKLYNKINRSTILNEKNKKSLKENMNNYFERSILKDENFSLMKNIILYKDYKKIFQAIDILVINDLNNDFKKWLKKNKKFISNSYYERIFSYINNPSNEIIIYYILNLLKNDNIKMSLLTFFSYKLKEKIIIDDNVLNMVNEILDILEYDYEIRMKLDTLEDYNKVKYRLINKLENIIKKANYMKEIFNAISKKKIILTNNFKNNKFDLPEIKLINDDYDDHIITIDESYTPDLDGAFSIKDLGDVYSFDVYVSDVPSFLNANREVATEAYERANSYYFRKGSGKGNDIINMLPETLAYDYLSLNIDAPKNVIAFNFIIDKNGNILSSSVNKKVIKVTDAVTPDSASRIINGIVKSPISNELKMLQNICKILTNNSNKNYIKILNYKNISDLVGIPSLLVNYYIAKQSNIVIFRDDGIYKDNGYYSHSSTPIRKIVSDINLGLFLNQNGLLLVDDKDIYRVEDNIEEIIEHCNERDTLSKFIDRNSNQVLKYLLK